jgi:MFS family permease
VFLLVAATFSTIYLTQPVLPVLRKEFGIDAAKASLTVSAVIFGIALATLPFGRLADRFPARPIILSGGTLFFTILIHNVMATIFVLISGVIVGIIPAFSIGANGFVLGVVYRQTAEVTGYWEAALKVLPPRDI